MESVLSESLGICLGASTIGAVRLRKNGAHTETVWAKTRPHEGNPRRVLRNILEEIEDIGQLRVAATGRKFRHHLALTTISEPEAVERAAAHVLGPGHSYRVIISAGGETFLVYHLDGENRIQGIYAGNKCASGTGEFFLQQMGRMALSLDEATAFEIPETFHKVSGRCSVFCKSDCTHALNKGIPKPQVLAGLSRMLAGKALELLKKLPKTSAMLIGGCAQNAAMVHYLRESIQDLYIPESASYFEALGAGLWALERETAPVAGIERLFTPGASSLTFLKPLSVYRGQVRFDRCPRGAARAGDRTILGLDVGSTTTKGVIMRRSDKAILAADYLRTNGDPVGASRRVYESLARQIETPIAIEGLGVTGSGRQIAGLHAMTRGIINEIIAHAAAAVHFDPEVDTIFEIGGQDAKYTYLTNGVASDYAMNEACSAGTGSFLEESAKESLGIDMTEIGPVAFKAERPANFNDQCAAFIGSDIKRAAQEGVSVPDIVAGLVYSICMNYTNRVKGNRPVGKKIFMQGGVCYNEAVPVAMAALTGKNIVVPPEPGLMGAFGVALEAERRIEQGLIEPGAFRLDELAARDVVNRDPFKCAGGKEGCDLGCEIARMEIDGRLFLFGGLCSRYSGRSEQRDTATAGFNLVTRRERRIFRGLAPVDPQDPRPTVGLNRSFLVHAYFPFFNRFFAELGFRVILPNEPLAHGADQQGAAFCFPVELAHAYAADLLEKNPDFLFLPHIGSVHNPNRDGFACTCVFVQGEPYYLPAAFPEFTERGVLRPHLDFSKGVMPNQPALREVGARLGAGRKQADAAARAAWNEQTAFWSDAVTMGRQALQELEHEPEAIAIVLFGRAYNSFVSEANKGIPAKFASRGIRVIPCDTIECPNESLPLERNMYWGSGRQILESAQYVAKHPRLFGVYITNFSCGPDSFLTGYFRDTMGRKPSLTLELDNHTADAGIETRIDAFLDIVRAYRRLEKEPKTPHENNGFRPAAIEFLGKKAGMRTSSGAWAPLDDARVKVVLPAMGRYGSPLLAKAFASRGVRAETLPPADEEALRLGRGHSTCKECLPLQTTIGSLLYYLPRRPGGELTVYLMPSTEGPCRFGQYHVFAMDFLRKNQIPDVAVLSLTSANGYAGLGDRVAAAAWQGIVIGDVFDEMYSTILAGAADADQGLAILEGEHRALLEVIHRGTRAISRQLDASARQLAQIRLKMPYVEIPKLSLVGEIYVRRDPISLQGIVERLAALGFIVRTSQTSEWIKYVDWLAKKGLDGERSLGFWARHWIKGYLDRNIRRRLAPSGLFFFEEANVEPVIEAGAHFISPHLMGEAILTVGSAFHEILHPSCGVILIGPFGCMPSRVAESILSEKLSAAEVRALASRNGHGPAALTLPENGGKLPLLPIETDGNAFPQIIEARLEAFVLQARRVHDMLQRQPAGRK